MRLGQVTLAAGAFRGLATQFRSEGPFVAARCGYMGGEVDDPTPEQVASNTTGHAEVVEVSYDADVVPLRRLLEIWWTVHDATLDPRDGPPERHRYRSAVFYAPDQEEEVRAWLVARAAETSRPILTSIEPLGRLWPAPEHLQHHIERTGVEQRRLKPLEATEAAPDDGYGDAERCAYDTGIVTLAGRPFSGHFHTDSLRQAFCGRKDAVDFALATMRSSLEDAAVDASGYPLTGSSTLLVPWATEGRAQWSFPGVDHTVVAVLDAGNPLPLLTVHHWEICTCTMVEPPVPEVGDLPFVGPREFPSVATMRQVPARRDRPPALKALSAGEERSAVAEDAEAHTNQNDGGAATTAGAWYEHVPPVECHFEVGDDKPHVIRWDAGTIALESHPGRVDRARTLSVLAGEICPCFQVLDLWDPVWIEQRWHERAVLNSLSRSSQAMAPPDRCDRPIEADAPQIWSSDVTSDDPTVPPLPDRNDPELMARAQTGSLDEVTLRTIDDRVLGPLAQLPDELQRRWLLGAIAHLEAQGDRAARADRLALEGMFLAALRSAVSGALWQWCRFDPTIDRAHLVTRYLPPGQAAYAEGRVEAGHDALAGDAYRVALIEVGATFRWFTHVWARGLAVLDDHLVLRVDGPADAAELDVVVAGWHSDESGSAPVLMTRDARATWDGDLWRLR